MTTSQTKEADSGAVRVESDRDSPMIVVVLEDGSRALFASEDDEWAIAAANPGCDTWSPTWHAFDVTGPQLDFGGIEATLEAAIEARRGMAEREPAVREFREPETRTVAWWDEQATRSGIKRPPDYVRSSCSNLRTGPRPDPGGVHGVLQLFRPVLGHRHALPAT